MKTREKFPFLFVIVLFTILIIASIFGLYINMENEKIEYFESSIHNYDAQIDSTLESYSRFSDYIYNSVIYEDEYILNIVSEAYTADETTQAIYRQELYDYLIEEYEFMKEYDFRQFHFHFPDSSSFLRVHAPEKFGDSLYDVRYSIRTVNEYYTLETGFEEGRIFNGYRYVYPLTYNDEHIGSVEISISLSSVINVLSGLYNTDYCFILSKNSVDNIVFDENISNYTESFISEDFYTDIACFSDVEERNVIPQAEFEEFFSGINKNDLNGLNNFEDFGLISSYENENYEVLFSSIENIEGTKVGYFISIHEEEGISIIVQHFSTFVILAVGFYIISILVSVFIIKNRMQLKILSNTDRLTNLDNRRKFEKDVNRELGRSKRSNTPLSFILFDIDHFKEINDIHGHHKGDVVLRELSNLIGSLIRKEDYLSRYGGEEFLIMLVDTTEINAYNKAESLRNAVEQYDFSFNGKVKISLGVLEHSIGVDEYDTIIEKVDRAMYHAKETGRNKSVSYSNIKTP